MPSREALKNLPMRIFGWFATLLPGDPTIMDRWIWVRTRLLEGDLRTLDAGCGSGTFAMYAAKRGNQVVGLSFDERNNRVATERASILGLPNVEFRTGDLRRLDRLDGELGTFDQIICFEVIEHILDDQRLIRDLASLLRPGGRLFLTTPSADHRPLKGEVISDSEDGGHVRFGYSHDDLRRLFEGASLRTVSLGYLTGPLSQAILRIQFRLARINWRAAWLLTLPPRVLQVLDPMLGRSRLVPHLYVTGIAVAG